MRQIKVSLTGVGGYGRSHYKLIRRRGKDDLLDFCGVVIRRSSMEKYADDVRELNEMHVPRINRDDAWN